MPTSTSLTALSLSLLRERKPPEHRKPAPARGLRQRPEANRLPRNTYPAAGALTLQHADSGHSELGLHLSWLGSDQVIDRCARRRRLPDPSSSSIRTK